MRLKIVLFFGLFFVAPLPEIFLPTPLFRYSFIHQGTSTRKQRSGSRFGFRVKLPPVSTIYPLISRGNFVKCHAQRHNKWTCRPVLAQSSFMLNVKQWSC